MNQPKIFLTKEMRRALDDHIRFSYGQNWSQSPTLCGYNLVTVPCLDDKPYALEGETREFPGANRQMAEAYLRKAHELWKSWQPVEHMTATEARARQREFYSKPLWSWSFATKTAIPVTVQNMFTAGIDTNQKEEVLKTSEKYLDSDIFYNEMEGDNVVRVGGEDAVVDGVPEFTVVRRKACYLNGKRYDIYRRVPGETGLCVYYRSVPAGVYRIAHDGRAFKLVIEPNDLAKVDVDLYEIVAKQPAKKWVFTEDEYGNCAGTVDGVKFRRVKDYEGKWVVENTNDKFGSQSNFAKVWRTADYDECGDLVRRQNADEGEYKKANWAWYGTKITDEGFEVIELNKHDY